MGHQQNSKYPARSTVWEPSYQAEVADDYLEDTKGMGVS